MTHLRDALLGIGASLVIATGAQAADHVLSGAVSSASGQRLDGVTVYAKQEGATITTTVYTDSAGRYFFPPLPAGRYRVSAQALGFELATGVVELTAKRAHNLVMQPMTDAERRIRQLPSELLVAALPEATPEDARNKKTFMNTCTGCHPSGYVLQFRYDEAGWNKVISLMTFGGRLPGERVNRAMAHHQKDLAAYLAKARGPGESSMKFTTRSRPTGEAARVVWKLYDVPMNEGAGLRTRETTHDGTDWSLGFPAKLGAAVPHDSVMDQQGDLYYTVNNRHRLATIGKVDGKTGEVSYFKAPSADGLAAFSHGMALDAKGIVWFDVNPGPRHSLGKFDPKSQKITVYTPPMDMSPVGLIGTTVDVDGKGMVWVTARDGALRFDPTTEKFTGFKSLTRTGYSYGVSGDRDGNGWWANLPMDTVGKGDVTTGKVTEIKLPPNKAAMVHITPEDRTFYDKLDAEYQAGGEGENVMPWSQGPRRMGVDRNADVLWVGNAWGSSLTRIDTKTNAFTILPVPDPTMQTYHIAVDSGHNVWGDLWTSDQLFRLDPRTNTWSLFDLPVHGTEARHIAVQERDGKVHVVVPITRASKMGVMVVRSEAELAALAAQAQ